MFFHGLLFTTGGKGPLFACVQHRHLSAVDEAVVLEVLRGQGHALSNKSAPAPVASIPRWAAERRASRAASAALPNQKAIYVSAAK